MSKYGTALGLVKREDRDQGVQVTFKQPYIAAVQYRHGLELYQEDMTLNQATALRRYFFQLQMADEVGKYVVLPMSLIKGLPDEAKGIINRPDPVEQVTSNLAVV